MATGFGCFVIGPAGCGKVIIYLINIYNSQLYVILYKNMEK
jgi:hypothetical protein